jgi:hypothetical protein
MDVKVVPFGDCTVVTVRESSVLRIGLWVEATPGCTSRVLLGDRNAIHVRVLSRSLASFLKKRVVLGLGISRKRFEDPDSIRDIQVQVEHMLKRSPGTAEGDTSVLCSSPPGLTF